MLTVSKKSNKKPSKPMVSKSAYIPRGVVHMPLIWIPTLQQQQVDEEFLLVGKWPFMLFKVNQNKTEDIKWVQLHQPAAHEV